MNKEQKKIALEWAREKYEKATDAEKKHWEFVFPELKESEDERIRKELLKEIELIIPRDGETDDEGRILPSYRARIDRYKSYLEKQKEPRDPFDDEQFRRGYEAGIHDAERKYQSAEWSEEDEKMIENAISSINQESVIEGLKSRGISFSIDSSAHLMNNLINWLKSLRHQPHWKPSEEQKSEPERPKDDWEEYRKQLAKEIFLIYIKSEADRPINTPQVLSEAAADAADALIEELKKDYQ